MGGCFMAVKSYRRRSKVSTSPKRPYDKERIDSELKLVGVYGLRNKREIWRVQFTLGKIRFAARELLTLPENDQGRIFREKSLLRKLTKLGLLNETQQSLEFVLGLTVEAFLGRRLQHILWRSGNANSVHHARCLITQKHIAVNGQLVDQPNFMVRTATEGYIDYHPLSPYAEHEDLAELQERRIERIKQLNTN